MPQLADRWAAAGNYEQFMGRWSRRLAPHFVGWLQLPAALHWLDVGCGTGALTAAICQHAAPTSVLGCDPSQPFLDYARQHVTDPRAAFMLAGAGSLPRRFHGYGAIASLLVLNFLPHPAAAVQEMRALAAPSATLSACVWDYAEGMGFLRHFWDAAAALDPRARQLDEGARFPICRPQALTQLFEDAGLGQVICQPIVISTIFASFQDYWTAFQGGAGPAPTYVATLDHHARAALAQQLQQTVPQNPDGAITLTARAWAVRGIVP